MLQIPNSFCTIQNIIVSKIYLLEANTTDVEEFSINGDFESYTGRDSIQLFFLWPWQQSNPICQQSPYANFKYFALQVLSGIMSQLINAETLFKFWIHILEHVMLALSL